MAENLAPLPVCVLKVDLSFCSKCPIKVKNKFQEIKGVRSISIDRINGEVTVCGFMDPHKLQTVIEEMGKRAEILAYEKERMKAKSKPEQQFKNKKREKHKTDDKDCLSKDKKRVQKKFKNHSSSYDSDSDVDDESVNGKKIPMPPPPNYGTGNDNAGWYGPSPGPGPGGPGPVDPRMYGGYTGTPPGYARPYMVRGPMAAPPPPPPYWYSWYPVTYGGQKPMHLSRRPPRQKIPLTNLYAIYSGQKDPPVGNSLFHKFSDDDVNSCSIM